MIKPITILEQLLADLPEEKAQEVVDFAAYLRRQYTTATERGSARAILNALDEEGPLLFAEGELDSLLAELEAMRQLDLSDRD
ncbi:MAG: DUF2281 domain-containing protein [Anaerolineae bacterium]|nr:DUF2281 domain-containing protein [Anaerolineae bacterium]